MKKKKSMEKKKPHFKESAEPPECGRRKAGFSPRAFGGNIGLPTPDLYNWENTFLLFKPTPVCCVFL